MGVCLTYTAIRDGDPDAVCESLRLRRTGELGWFLDAKFAGIALPSDWYAVVTNSSLRFCKDAILSTLSSDAMVLSCFVEEHVMHSSLSSWENGAEMWSVTHDCNNGLAHLERTGTVPTEIAAIADQEIAKQAEAGGNKAGVDYVFDVPVAAMAHYTGLRHDRINSAIEGRFETLELIRVGLIQRLKSLVIPNKAT